MEKIASPSFVADDSIATLLSRVVSDAQLVARSEIDLQKAKLGAKVDEAKGGVVLALGAVVLASLALIALVVGALMVLTPRVGPLAATGIVAGVLLVAAGLFGFLASRHFRRMFAAGAVA
ncbi:phage holin family protein [Sphingomonas sp. PAMC 26605]|uniref:phage holin family protein n=1 Tax=Sphingomonas sp. PAMC 26605 TaxID=1112214 RepID=UPI000495397A|nr:phage holin family protein [Sphingomonas sp. PAMC 26605]